MSPETLNVVATDYQKGLLDRLNEETKGEAGVRTSSRPCNGTADALAYLSFDRHCGTRSERLEASRDAGGKQRQGPSF